MRVEGSVFEDMFRHKVVASAMFYAMGKKSVWLLKVTFQVDFDIDLGSILGGSGHQNQHKSI